MNIKEFKADITNLVYGKTPKYKCKNEFNYYLRLTVKEVLIGKQKKSYHKGILYINKEDYEKETFSINDRLLFTENVKFTSKSLKYSSYDEKIIEKKLKNEYEKRNVKIDEKGKSYWSDYVNAYTFTAKIGDIKLLEKAEEIHYVKIANVKYPMEESEFNENIYRYYINEKDFEDFKEFNNKIVELKFYKRKKIKSKSNYNLRIIQKSTSKILELEKLNNEGF